jgi:hypothetical protein
MSHRVGDSQIGSRRFSARSKSIRRGDGRRASKRARIMLLATFVVAAAAICVLVSVANASEKATNRGHVRLTLRLGPAPTRRSGRLPGRPGRDPNNGGPSPPGPARHGVFTMAGAFRDRGKLVFRLPSFRSTKLESRAVLHNKNGSLRLGLDGGDDSTTGTSSSGPSRWHVISGTGTYAGAVGSGRLTETPQVDTLVGSLRLRQR